MKAELGSERFWVTMNRGAAYQLGLGILLWLLAIILFSQMGCAYLQAPPHYDNLDKAVNGSPATGRLSAQDAQDILKLRERRDALEFEKSLAAVVEIQNSTTPMSMPGIPGIIYNLSRYETVTFLITGPTNKTFTLFPGEKRKFVLPEGEYNCQFLRGSYSLARPRGFHVNHQADWFFGEWVFWGLYYQDY
ncbi:hypothetical protein A3G56_00895 [Candidatus Falkowbacteria bacterium RIFCSPLOWO2_12_FULL_45_10]|uniref:Uncharacterized protein n=1 Tax=Candidatus Falkowbacteria bacterium RIFCSPLOWO2_12_FULL_45_10 TaxID=1797990 RepID=A0A1F5RVN7_9BACT|nr:MAG: hypothetical protein A3G56_00895 [Candidatus Falkowbacteria bacterium RIFCSPLOWO2_12_FULL_45_10]